MLTPLLLSNCTTSTSPSSILLSNSTKQIDHAPQTRPTGRNKAVLCTSAYSIGQPLRQQISTDVTKTVNKGVFGAQPYGG
jgi:hypothetical protein